MGYTVIERSGGRSVISYPEAPPAHIWVGPFNKLCGLKILLSEVPLANGWVRYYQDGAMCIFVEERVDELSPVDEGDEKVVSPSRPSTPVGGVLSIGGPVQAGVGLPIGSIGGPQNMPVGIPFNLADNELAFYPLPEGRVIRGWCRGAYFTLMSYCSNALGILLDGYNLLVGCLSCLVLLGASLVYFPMNLALYMYMAGAVLFSYGLAITWGAWWIRIARAAFGFKRSVRTFLLRAKNAVSGWWKRGWEEKISVFGYPVPVLSFLGVGVFVALVVFVVVWSQTKETEEEKKARLKTREIEPQSGLCDWFTDPKRRALLNASLFVTSLVSFGNLKWFRQCSPVVSFMGWIGQLLPGQDASVGCVLSPNCASGKASGEFMCRDCGVKRATRQLDSPRFYGPNKFTPHESYAALCEDIITKASIDWFLNCPIELRKCIVRDEEIRKDIESGEVYVSVDSSTGAPFIRSRRDPMTIASLSHKKLYVSAGLLPNELSIDQISGADMHSSDLGIGFKMVSSRTVSEVKSAVSDDRPLGIALADEEEFKHSEFHPLPRGADPAVDPAPDDNYWLFLKNGVWTLWKSAPVVVKGWTVKFKIWKNTHPKLSSSLDVMLICVSMFVVYLACTASYERVSEWLKQKWKSYSPINMADVENEGRGMKHRHVAKAEGTGKFKERHVPDEIYRRVRTDEEKEPNLDDVRLFEPSLKKKNYIFYDIQSIEEQIAAGGVVMVNSKNQKLTATTKKEYERLLSSGYRVFSESLQANDGLKVPLSEYRDRKKEYDELFKIIHWASLAKSKGVQTRMSLRPELIDLFESKVEGGRAKSTIKPIVELLRSNFKNNIIPSQLEKESFNEWFHGEVSSGEVLESKIQGAFADLRERFRKWHGDGESKDVEVLESNIQAITDLRCPNTANGHSCKIKGCWRCANAASNSKSDKMDIIPEALLSPEKRVVSLDCVYQVMVRSEGDWIKQGTAFAGPYGFYTARHVLYDDSGSLLFPLEDVRLVDRQFGRYCIDPLTLCTPRTEQLSPGQRNDFCKFRTTDIVFNKKANVTRVSFRSLQSTNRNVRILRYTDSSPDPIERTGEVVRMDKTTGVCEYTCNTIQSDSGAPVFGDDGHCVGMHTGHNRSTGRNVFILIYPDVMVSWFVQAEPKNL